jgi:uncharacterized protein (DUF849 family)
MCSLTLGSLNFVNQASVNSPDVIQGLAEKMQQFGVKPELECFDLGMINYGHYLIGKGWLAAPYYWNLFFGNIAGAQADMAQIGLAVQQITGQDHYIALAGLGEAQLPVNAHAIAAGYGVRVGLEDNLWLDSAHQPGAAQAHPRDDAPARPCAYDVHRVRRAGLLQWKISSICSASAAACCH